VVTRNPGGDRRRFCTIGVSADEMELSPEHCLVFWCIKDGARAYVIVALAPSEWRSVTIQSAITGFQNGYEVLQSADAATVGRQPGNLQKIQN
jgi:hypothetical protein